MKHNEFEALKPGDVVCYIADGSPWVVTEPGPYCHRLAMLGCLSPGNAAYPASWHRIGSIDDIVAGLCAADVLYRSVTRRHGRYSFDGTCAPFSCEWIPNSPALEVTTGSSVPAEASSGGGLAPAPSVDYGQPVRSPPSRAAPGGESAAGWVCLDHVTNLWGPSPELLADARVHRLRGRVRGLPARSRNDAPAIGGGLNTPAPSVDYGQPVRSPPSRAAPGGECAALSTAGFDLSDFRPCCPTCGAHVPGNESAVCVPCAYALFRQTVATALHDLAPLARCVTDNGKRFHAWVTFPGEPEQLAITVRHSFNAADVRCKLGAVCMEARYRLGKRAVGR